MKKYGNADNTSSDGRGSVSLPDVGRRPIYGMVTSCGHRPVGIGENSG